jgi:hypothetical protein
MQLLAIRKQQKKFGGKAERRKEENWQAAAGFRLRVFCLILP